MLEGVGKVVVGDGILVCFSVDEDDLLVASNRLPPVFVTPPCASIDNFLLDASSRNTRPRKDWTFLVAVTFIVQSKSSDV